MYIPETYSISVFFMFITMICWGSWANMAKLDTTWRFELFYWDYTIGILLTSVLFAVTFGSFGSSGEPFFQSLQTVHFGSFGKAFLSGIIFNIANILLVGAISIAGMSVAFPIGIGIALVAGTIFSYLVKPVGYPLFLFSGVTLVLIAIILDAIAYKRKEAGSKNSSLKKGVMISIISGVLMSFFYPFIASSMRGTHPLTPYSAIFFFAIGVFLSNFIVNTIFMKKPVSNTPLSKSDYFNGTAKQHWMGIFGGVIWCVGISFNVIASTNAGPAIAYAFGQGATLIAAIWGVFIWKEFKSAPNTFSLLFWMFFCFFFGLFFIGLAKLI